LHLRDRLDRDLDAEAFERVDGAGPRPVDVAVLIVVRTKVAVLLPGGQDVVAGNFSSADDWEELLVPEIDRQQAEHQRVAFRADAAFARPAIYEALEARGVQYAIRIPANNNLELAVEDILFRSPGRPSLKPLIRYKSFQYQADSWTTPRRVVAKVEHHAGELFPRVGFIVTNLPLPNRAVVRFYNKRGAAEQSIKEGKQAAHWTRLSCHRFRANEVRLQLSVLAYNLGNLWRRLVLPARIEAWSLTSLQQRIVKTGGRLVKHARYYWLMLAESYLTRRLFGAMLQRIWALPVPAG
jgi:Transposase DDE domain group 1